MKKLKDLMNREKNKRLSMVKKIATIFGNYINAETVNSFSVLDLSDKDREQLAAIVKQAVENDIADSYLIDNAIELAKKPYISKGEKIKVLNGTVIVVHYRKDNKTDTDFYKIKLPTKTKLKAKNVTLEQFCSAVCEHYNGTYYNGAFNVHNTADYKIKRGYMFLSVNAICDF